MEPISNYINDGEFYKAVVEDGSDIIFIVDFQGNIHYYNPAVKETLGYDPKEIIGRSFNDFIHDDLKEAFQREFTLSTKKPFSESIEFLFLCKDGSYRYLEFNSINIYHKAKISGLILDCRDITQRKKDAEELMKAQKAKEQFLANMSHEIRTPINGISGMATLASETKDEAELMNYLKAIQKSSDSLKVIINDILDLSMIESGKLKFEKIGFSIRSQFDMIYNTFIHQVKNKNLILNIEIDPEADIIVIGDPVRLNQIIINLISNALKFTHVGRIDIQVSLKQKSNNVRYISFVVADTGIGIPQEKLNKIFESFTQADETVTRRYGGTGLGLTITKQLVDLQNGTITVKSVENKGSTFNITVPYIVGTESDLEENNAIISGGAHSLSKLKVLVIEDNDINRLYVTRLLMKWDASVSEAENGVKGVEKYSQGNYDIILMDLQMPVMDGLEATAVIRNKFKGAKSQVPIIALTANAIKGDNERCIAAGMTDYISKPFKPDELLEIIEKNLRLKPKKEAANVDHLIPKFTNMNHLNEICKGDLTFIIEMIDLFRDTIPKSISKMEHLTEDKSWGEIGRVAHSIKPSISLMGFDRGLALIKNIELAGSELKETDKIPTLIAEFKQMAEHAIKELVEYKTK